MFKNLDFKKFAFIFAVLVMCVSMMVPAVFAASATEADLELIEGERAFNIHSTNYEYNLLVNGKPLTIKYLKENPNYYVDISWEYAKSYDWYISIFDAQYIGNDNYGTPSGLIKQFGKSDEDSVTSFRLNAAAFSDIDKNHKYYETPLALDFYVDTNYSNSTSLNITVICPKPPAGLNDVLGGAVGFAESLFNIASQTVDWVLANPLALIVCVLGLFGLGVMILKVLSKGV